MENNQKKKGSSICLEIIVAGSIRIKNAPVALQEQIKRKLELPNPSYQQAIKRNPRAKYALSPIIKYYEQDRETGELILPRGILGNLRSYLASKDIGVRIEDRRVTVPCNFGSEIKLRDYQLGVPERIAQSTQGVVRADTGFGKSIVALQTAVLLQQKTLIIVPKLNLLTQFYDEAKRFTTASVGTIQGKNVDIQDITVATIQSLRNRINDDSVRHDTFGLVIVDECHLSVPKKTRSIIDYFSSRYRYGFTATARRTDQQGRAIGWIFGEKIVDKKIPRAKPTVEIVEFKDHMWVEEYHDMVQKQTENENRNQLIVDLIKREQDKGKKILVLTKRIAHYEEICERLEGGGCGLGGVISLNAKGNKKEKATLMAALRSGSTEFSVLLGTFSLLSTGVDIPSLDTLILAGDLKSDVLAEQSAGRVLRLFEGKSDPLIIDIHDTGNGIFKNQGRLRKKFYSESGWKII